MRIRVQNYTLSNISYFACGRIVSFTVILCGNNAHQDFLFQDSKRNCIFPFHSKVMISKQDVIYFTIYDHPIILFMVNCNIQAVLISNTLLFFVVLRYLIFFQYNYEQKILFGILVKCFNAILMHIRNMPEWISFKICPAVI